MKNVIILGAGRTGSSFLSGLISHNRFYIQQENISSRYSYPDGDYENPELKELNKKILWDSGYKYHKAMVRKPVDIEAIKALGQQPNDIYHDFMEKCAQNEPWLWKDPRLCFTIYHWDKYIKKDDIAFIRITRDPFLVFKSHSKKGIYSSLKDVVQTCHQENVAVDTYLSDHKIPFLNIDYSELKDFNIIKKLNVFLGIHISEGDYMHIRKDNKRKKESELKFNLRYAIGLLKLQLDNILSK